MNEEDDKYSVQIPGNIRLRMEVVAGVGVKELIYTSIVGVISAVIAFMLYGIFKNYLISVGLFLGVTAITFLLVMKDKNNSSVGIIILNIYKFFTKQRFFKYIKNNEYKEVA